MGTRSRSNGCEGLNLQKPLPVLQAALRTWGCNSLWSKVEWAKLFLFHCRFAAIRSRRGGSQLPPSSSSVHCCPRWYQPFLSAVTSPGDNSIIAAPIFPAEQPCPVQGVLQELLEPAASPASSQDSFQPSNPPSFQHFLRDHRDPCENGEIN